jgi:hypothetical protein
MQFLIILPEKGETWKDQVKYSFRASLEFDQASGVSHKDD